MFFFCLKCISTLEDLTPDKVVIWHLVKASFEYLFSEYSSWKKENQASILTLSIIICSYVFFWWIFLSELRRDGRATSLLRLLCSAMQFSTSRKVTCEMCVLQARSSDTSSWSVQLGGCSPAWEGTFIWSIVISLSYKTEVELCKIERTTSEYTVCYPCEDNMEKYDLFLHTLPVSVF